ncbi:MAG: MoxR family ATPase [Bacteroidetes bacterium]|jgi:MoxR-like ATPase|nr:MoxR family ATPase [Bacteroidota bacterium]MBP7257260.1 MoxR family ATPase [Chitinophagales bacterium]MBK7641211.1 MoxR family ATPase [Bacteroidota bacterium]MBK8673667.1 MoxR family ATPase [Bacteroidota bacterium]MBK9354303.1 MoxR family ATPase [Bacteroidota bacterium]
MDNIEIGILNDQIKQESSFLDLIKEEVGKNIIGQKYMTDRLLLALLCQGHILLEGVPGLAKTLAIKSLSDAVSVGFSRIQFTPDLLPADIIGTMIYNQGKGNFEVRKGPIFSNFILADEINRAPAKVQSALLQAMQEKVITIGNETFKLEEPFMVMATQNPIEQEGTYPLPEAQVDRFMLKIKISYPEFEEERQIMRQNVLGIESKINPVVNAKQLIAARTLVKKVYMDEKIEQYILHLVFCSRRPENYGLKDLMPLISYGGSPRASINLAMAAKAHAFMQKRGFVIPEDVRAICYDVLRHRIGITYEAEAENINSDDIISQILNKVNVP